MSPKRECEEYSWKITISSGVHTCPLELGPKEIYIQDGPEFCRDPTVCIERQCTAYFTICFVLRTSHIPVALWWDGVYVRDVLERTVAVGDVKDQKRLHSDHIRRPWMLLHCSCSRLLPKTVDGEWREFAKYSRTPGIKFLWLAFWYPTFL